MLDARIMVKVVILPQKNVKQLARKIPVQTRNIRRVLHGEPVMHANALRLRVQTAITVHQHIIII